MEAIGKPGRNSLMIVLCDAGHKSLIGAFGAKSCDLSPYFPIWNGHVATSLGNAVSFTRLTFLWLSCYVRQI